MVTIRTSQDIRLTDNDKTDSPLTTIGQTAAGCHKNHKKIKLV